MSQGPAGAGEADSSGVWRRVVLVAVGALVVVVGLGAVALLRGDPSPEPGPGPAPSPTPSVVERTLLVQVLDTDGYALGNVVIGAQPEGQPRMSTFLRVPSSLLIPVGDDSITLGAAPANPDTLASVQGLSRELRLRIDAGLTMDRLAFAGLVDAAGGVVIDVPEPVVLPPDADGVVRILGPGIVAMDGVTAADYALARMPGEPESARVDRLATVFDLALEGLPGDPDQMRQVLTSLGSLAKSTVPTDELVPFLIQVRADMRFTQVQYAVLPVDVIRLGIRPASVPAPEADALLQQLFPDARLPASV